MLVSSVVLSVALLVLEVGVLVVNGGDSRRGASGSVSC